MKDLRARIPTGGVGIIFDMDGVLVDSYQPHFESWRLLGREHGREIGESEFAATFGRTSRDIIELLFGGERDPAEIRRLDDRKEAIYRDLIRGRVPIMNGARELLADLRASGARLAVGSSGPVENVELVLDALRTTVSFDAVVTGADVSRGKPDPQVFLLAAERLRVSVERCVVIEDAPAGVAAARAAGMRVIGLAAGHTAGKLGLADLVVADLGRVGVDSIAALVQKDG